VESTDSQEEEEIWEAESTLFSQNWRKCCCNSPTACSITAFHKVV